MSGALEGNTALFAFPDTAIGLADAEFHGSAPISALAHVTQRIEPVGGSQSVARSSRYREAIAAIGVPLRKIAEVVAPVTATTNNLTPKHQ